MQRKKTDENIGSKKVLHSARLTGGGSKAIWAIPIWKQHISKRGFPKVSLVPKMSQFDTVEYPNATVLSPKSAVYFILGGFLPLEAYPVPLPLSAYLAPFLNCLTQNGNFGGLEDI